MSRWVVHACTEFDARHALTSYLGHPEAPHEHRWRVEVRAAVAELNAESYAVDFHALRSTLERCTDKLAGTDLNLHPEIGRPSPTAEHLAVVLAGWISPEVRALGADLVGISVWEGPDNRVDLELG